MALVVILDADKEGFLRSAQALIQTSGRAARNVNGTVIMYADRETAAMKLALSEMSRRREKQIAYNKEHGITPQTIVKAIRELEMTSKKKKGKKPELDFRKIPKEGLERLIHDLENQMKLASQNLEFEKAAELRDQVEEMREMLEK